MFVLSLNVPVLNLSRQEVTSSTITCNYSSWSLKVQTFTRDQSSTTWRTPTKTLCPSVCAFDVHGHHPSAEASIRFDHPPDRAAVSQQLVSAPERGGVRRGRKHCLYSRPAFRWERCCWGAGGQSVGVGRIIAALPLRSLSRSSRFFGEQLRVRLLRRLMAESLRISPGRTCTSDGGN